MLNSKQLKDHVVLTLNLIDFSEMRILTKSKICKKKKNVTIAQAITYSQKL